MAIRSETLGGVTVIVDDLGGLAIDYSAYFDQIATDVTAIAADIATIAADITAIKTSIETIEDKITAMELHQSAVKNKVIGDGVHVIGPYEWLSQSSIVKYYQDQGIDPASLKPDVDSLPKGW